MTRVSHEARSGRRPARAGDPGMVLVIVVLIAIGLSVLGAVVVENTRMDTSTSGHVRQAEQSGYVAEVGTMVGMRTFSINYSIYRRYMRRNGLLNYTFNRLSFDTGGAGTPVTLELGSMASAGSLGYGDLRPEYAVLVDRPYEFGDAAGYSVSGTQGVSFCFRRYTFTTASELDATISGSPRAASRAVLRATGVIGPTDCTL